MVYLDGFEWYEKAPHVLENKKAYVAYNEKTGEYIAIEKIIRGNGFGISPFYHKSTKGNFKRCKNAFEKYSGISKEKPFTD